MRLFRFSSINMRAHFRILEAKKIVKSGIIILGSCNLSCCRHVCYRELWYHTWFPLTNVLKYDKYVILTKYILNHLIINYFIGNRLLHRLWEDPDFYCIRAEFMAICNRMTFWRQTDSNYGAGPSEWRLPRDHQSNVGIISVLSAHFIVHKFLY